MSEQIIRSDSTAFPRLSADTQEIHNFNQAISGLQQLFASSSLNKLDVKALLGHVKTVYSFLRNEFGTEAFKNASTSEKQQITTHLNMPDLISIIKHIASNIIEKANVSDAGMPSIFELSEQSLVILKHLAKNASALGMSRDEVSQVAQAVVTTTKHLIQTEKDPEEQTRSLSLLQGEYYLDYLKDVYSEEELKGIKTGIISNTPIISEDFDFVSQEILLPKQQDISYIDPQGALNFPVKMHYKNLTEEQCEEIKHQVAQSWKEFTKTWMGEGLPRHAHNQNGVELPTTTVYITDDHGDFNLAARLFNHATSSFVSGQFYSGSNEAFLYQHKKDPDYLKYVLLHELTHAYTYRVFGSLQSSHSTLSEGIATYYADPEGERSWQSVLGEKELTLSDILKSGEGYTLGALFMKYLIETPEHADWRTQILKSVQQENKEEMNRLLEEFAQKAQPGFEVFLSNLRKKLDPSVPFYKELRSLILNIQDKKEGLFKVQTLINQEAPHAPLSSIENAHELLRCAITNLNTDISIPKLLVENGIRVDKSMLEIASEYRGKYSTYVRELQQLLANQQKLTLLDTSQKDGYRVSEIPMDLTTMSDQAQPLNSPFIQAPTYEEFTSLIKNDIQSGEGELQWIQTLINHGAPLIPSPGMERQHGLISYAIFNKNTDIELVKLLVANGAPIDESMLQWANNYRGENSAYVLEFQQQLSASKNQREKRSVASQDASQGEINNPGGMERKEATEISNQATLSTDWLQAKQALIDSDYNKFKLLLPKIKVHIAQPDEMGRNLFHYAALHGDSRIVNELSKACIEQFNQETDSHTVGSFGLPGNPPIGRFYDVLSCPDQAGNSPLHLVIQKNRGERLAQTFISQGAQLKSPVNHLGQTPISLAKQDTRLSPFFDRMLRTQQIQVALKACDIKEASKLLQEENRLYRHGMSFEIWNRSDGTGHKRVNGANLLHYAVQYYASEEVMTAIVDKGVDVNYQDQEGETPLHYAVRTGNFFALTPLLKSGASLEIKNKKGETPWDLAGEDMRVHIQSAQELVESSVSINRNARLG